MIPGDLTNSVKTESLTFASAFKNLESTEGIFASLGNHDYFRILIIYLKLSAMKPG